MLLATDTESLTPAALAGYGHGLALTLTAARFAFSNFDWVKNQEKKITKKSNNSKNELYIFNSQRWQVALLDFDISAYSHLSLLPSPLLLFACVCACVWSMPARTHTHAVRNSSIIQMAFLRADYPVVCGIFTSCWHVNKNKNRKPKKLEWYNWQNAKNRMLVDNCRQWKYASIPLENYMCAYMV